jgi:hypothetical protein
MEDLRWTYGGQGLDKLNNMQYKHRRRLRFNRVEQDVTWMQGKPEGRRENQKRNPKTHLKFRYAARNLEPPPGRFCIHRKHVA